MLALILSPIGRMVGIGAIVLAVIGGAYLKGSNDARDKINKAMVKATVEQLKQRGQIDAEVSKSDIEEICIELGGSPDDCRVQQDGDK